MTSLKQAEKCKTIFFYNQIFPFFLTYEIFTHLPATGWDIFCSILDLIAATPPYLFLYPSSTKMKWVWSAFRGTGSPCNITLLVLYSAQNCPFKK